MKEVQEKSIIKDTPDISVIIPVNNVEKYLKRCLDSILTNTYKNIEVICIDDGSTDNSWNILKFYAAKDKRVKIMQQINKGPSAARNKGLDIARGKYISFVDSDDFISFNAYEILMLVAEKYKLDITIFGANAFPQNNVPEWINNIINTKYKFYENCNGSRIVFQEPSCRPFLWMHFIKRTLFEKPTRLRFDETMKLGEDQLLQLQYVPRAQNIMVIEDKLYNYRISRSGSLMQLYSSRRINKIETHLALVQKVINVWKNDGIFEENEDELVTWIVNFLYFSIVDLPVTYKKKYSKKILELFDKNKLATYLIAEWEQPRYAKLQEWSVMECSSKSELLDLEKKIQQEKYEIRETLKSRAFRIGRAFTKKQDRMDLQQFSDILNWK